MSLEPHEFDYLLSDPPPNNVSRNSYWQKQDLGSKKRELDLCTYALNAPKNGFLCTLNDVFD